MNINQLIEFGSRHSMLVAALLAILAMLAADTIEEQREVGPTSLGGQAIEGGHFRDPQPPARPLVGGRRVVLAAGRITGGSS